MIWIGRHFGLGGYCSFVTQNNVVLELGVKLALQRVSLGFHRKSQWNEQSERKSNFNTLG